MYHKIQPEQVQLHAFSSPSGDINFDVGSNYVHANLSRSLTGDFNIQGTLNINGFEIFASDSTNSVTGENSLIFGGANNSISGDESAFINSYFSDSLGSGNLGLNTRYSSFLSGSKDNTILAGRDVVFETGIFGSTAIKDQDSTSLSVNKNKSLIISFDSGTFFQNGNVEISNGNLFLAPSNSGLFSGDLHALGTIFENGVPVATTGDLGVTSGILNTRILGTGAYAVAVSGNLSTNLLNTGLYAVLSSGLLDARILSTGNYAVASSGLLDARINTSVFRTGTQIISGEKTFHQNLNLAQSVIISGASGILSGATGRTQIVPVSSGDSVGNRGLVAYSGQFLYLKISDNPHIWARHSGSINWP